MPPNRIQYETLAILKAHSRRNLMHVARKFHRDLEEIRSVYYSKDQVKVGPTVIPYKGVNGVLETQGSCGAVS